jgi:hypothetical protein
MLSVGLHGARDPLVLLGLVHSSVSPWSDVGPVKDETSIYESQLADPESVYQIIAFFPYICHASIAKVQDEDQPYLTQGLSNVATSSIALFSNANTDAPYRWFHNCKQI